MVALKEETILDKWREECSSYGENFDTYQKIEALQGPKTTCKSSKMDLNHDELQSTTEKMLLFLFKSNSTVKLIERNGFWSQVYLNGFLVQPLTGCMTTYKLFNVTCAMGITLPCNYFKNYKKYNQKVLSTVPGTKQDSINGSYY